MKPLASLLLPLAAFALTLSACGADVADDPNRIHVDEGFSFVPPPGWEKAPSPVGAPAIFMTGEIRGEFCMNLNVNVSALPQDGQVLDAAFFDNLAGELAPQYAKMFTNYSLRDHEVVEFDEHVGLRMSANFDQGVHEISNVQYMFPDGQTLFVFTYTCRRADWDEMSPIFRTSGESIRFD